VTVLEGEDTPLGPIILFDRDSSNSIFRVQIASNCGYLTVKTIHNITFTTENNSQQSYLNFQGLYEPVRYALLSIYYKAKHSCSIREGEFLSLKVMNTDNNDQTLSLVLPVSIVRVNIAPEIISGGIYKH
jgi:hypothetical protein